MKLTRMLPASCMLLSLMIPQALLAQKPTGSESPSYYNIGGVLSNNESESHFATVIAVSVI